MSDWHETEGDPEETGGGLSAGAAALLRDRMRASSASAPTLAPERLAAYLCGALAAPETAETERALTRSASARRMLLDVRAELDTLESMPYSQAAERASGLAGPVGEAARAWTGLVAAGTRTVAPQAGLAASVQALREQAARGVAEAAAAWRHLVAFAEQWREAAQAPRLALARGAAPTDDADVAIEHAEATAQGALRVSAAVKRLPGGAPGEGAEVVLLLACGGETCPVATTAVENGRATWEVPDLAGVAGLLAGEVPHGLLAVAAAGAVAAPPDEVTLIVEARDARSRPLPPGVVRVVGRPTFEAGRLLVRVAVPAETRAAYPDAHLELRLRAAPGSRPLLGRWPVGEWTEEPRLLDVEAPGCPDGELPDCALLAFRLQEGAR